MVQIHSYKSAIEIFSDALKGKKMKFKEATKLYREIIDKNQCESLDFFINQEFPHGADEDELHEFFQNEWKLIREEVFS